MKNKLLFKASQVAAFLLIFLFGISSLPGQTGEGMLIFQVDGNRYVRKNFKRNDNLITYQTLEIGKIKAFDEKIETKLTVITYFPDGTLKEASQTNLVCTPESKQVLMGIFPFAGTKTKNSLEVEMDDNAILYPSGWRQLSELKDFNFHLNLKGGAIGFLGAKSTVSISNRKVKPLKKTFGVSGKVIIKAYALGIRISTIKYDFFEEIDAEKGIVKQKFTEQNGDYFTVEISE